MNQYRCAVKSCILRSFLLNLMRICIRTVQDQQLYHILIQLSFGNFIISPRSTVRKLIHILGSKYLDKDKYQKPLSEQRHNFIFQSKIKLPIFSYPNMLRFENKMHGYSIIFILIFLLLPYEAVTQDAASATCKGLGGNREEDLQKLWNVITLYMVDRIIIFILCPILLVLQIIIVVMFARHPELLPRSGNIFLVLVVIQMGLNIDMLASAVYHQIYSQSPMPSHYPQACTALGVIQTLFQVNHISYLFLFLFYTIFLFRYNLKKKTQNFWRLLHILLFLLCVLATVLFYFGDLIGLNLFGICGFTQLYRVGDQQVYWNIIMCTLQIALNLLFFIVGLFTYKYYNKHMPEGSFKFSKDRYGILIRIFVVGFTVFLSTITLFSFFLTVSCLQAPVGAGFKAMTTIANTARILQYYFTIFLVALNDRLRFKLKFMFKSIFTIKKTKSISRLTQLQDQKNVEMEQIVFDQKLLMLKDKSNQIDLLFVSQIYTIISGIYAVYYEYYQKNFYQGQSQQVKAINFKESITIQIDNQTIKRYQFQTRLLLKLQILKCRLTLYSPKIFLKLLQLDGLNAVHQSFKILQNVKKIWNICDGQGGKSGEFFYFSADRRYVLKTISEEQFNFLKDNLQNFFQHYKSNPNSMIAKIYGLFTFKGNQIQRTYWLVLMKNITGCHKRQILRVYDLKGSKYNRQVVKQEQAEQNQLQDMTLKDVDFIKYENKLKISPQISTELRNAIQKDAVFLKQMNLIDYSLLVVRIIWKEPPDDDNFWGKLQRIPHLENLDEYYHIGIIDYLQKWDFQKKSQSWWKKVLGKKDISAINPKNYCQRFLQFMDQIAISYEQRMTTMGPNRKTIRQNQSDESAMNQPAEKTKSLNVITFKI